MSTPLGPRNARSAALQAVRVACRMKILAKRLNEEDPEKKDSLTASLLSPARDGVVDCEAIQSPAPEDGSLHPAPPKRQNPVLSDLSAMRELITSQWVNTLLVCVPLGLLAGFQGWSPITVFCWNFMALVPLALLLGDVTEDLALRLGPVTGGLVNATFGNVTEVVLSIAALHKGLLSVVANSLVGSILSNLLLVMGMSFFVGGFVRKTQEWNTTSNRSYNSLLYLASIGIVLPTAAAHVVPSQGENWVLDVSRGVAVLLLLCYVAYLVFQLHTHHDLFDEPEEEPSLGPPNPSHVDLHQASDGFHSRSDHQSQGTTVAKMLVTDAIRQIFVRWFLTGALEETSKDTGISTAFLSIVVLPIAGNACEHITAVVVASKDKMDLSLGIAVGSSLQIALFAIPVVVLVGWLIGQPMSLNYDLFSVIALMLAVMQAAQVTADAQSHWFMGVQLCVLYFLIAIVYWFRVDDPN
ncbi:cation exchanger 1 [Dunaliella salina]|uniref:Vacuolar cation/proton exchanger n=1 Tax=Dunaliella salina TaxID=3046 RepID=A0ABQ7H6F1_DUNSA|nr:cation exchanger 1 [Dunaliella salina]|eukprot:KAF5842439.1 cation exchanger 1 [Dunaliella salina]